MRPLMMAAMSSGLHPIERASALYVQRSGSSFRSWRISWLRCSLCRSAPDRVSASARWCSRACWTLASETTGEVADQTRHGTVEAGDIQHPRIARVGDAELRRGHAHDHEASVDP